jgi:hypothetical protein
MSKIYFDFHYCVAYNQNAIDNFWYHVDKGYGVTTYPCGLGPVFIYDPTSAEKYLISFQFTAASWCKFVEISSTREEIQEIMNQWKKYYESTL